MTYALDRLGRNAAHVLTLLEDLSQRDINVVSIRDGLDSSTTQGQIMMKLLSVVAELERSFIRERTVAGLAAAKAQGRVGGRPRALDSKRAKQAQVLRSAGNSPQDIAKLLGCSVSTVYRITRPSVPSNVPMPT